MNLNENVKYENRTRNNRSINIPDKLQQSIFDDLEKQDIVKNFVLETITMCEESEIVSDDMYIDARELFTTYNETTLSGDISKINFFKKIKKMGFIVKRKMIDGTRIQAITNAMFCSDKKVAGQIKSENVIETQISVKSMFSID